MNLPSVHRNSSYTNFIAPLVFGHLLLTPYGIISGDSRCPEWALTLRALSIDLPIEFAERNVMFSRHNLREGKLWTLVTHMFLHMNHSHLAANMLGLVVAGRRPYQAFGEAGVLTAYFGGGVLAMLEERLKNLQISKEFRSLFKLPERGGFFGQIGRGINKTMGTVAEMVVPAVQPYMNYLGASNGVASLFGMNLCLHVEEFIKVLKGQIPFDAVMMYNLISEGSYIVGLVLREQQHMRDGSGKGTDHAGHVVGFSVGVGVYAVFRIMKWYKKKQTRRTTT